MTENLERRYFYEPAAVKLFVSGKQAGACRVEKPAQIGYGTEGLDIGIDNISPVSRDYTSPFPFGGMIHSVTIAAQR